KVEKAERKEYEKGPGAVVWIARIIAVLLVTFSPRPSAAQPATQSLCAGDCNGDGEVAIDDLITMVNVLLGGVPLNACPYLSACEVTCLPLIIRAVNEVLGECAAAAPTSTPTATSTAASPTLTPTLIPLL